MEALILSCSTGGGHNAAAGALQEALSQRGHHVCVADPYEERKAGLGKAVGNLYVKLVQKAPHAFGVVYQIGDLYRRLPFRSPVYLANKWMIKTVEHMLKEHPVDVVIMPHLYPAEILTGMKNRGISLPMTVFVATDYACIPFTEETDCDFYVVPGPDLQKDFKKRGIPERKIRPFGIPVKPAFYQPLSKKEALMALGLNPGKKYLLLTGGSIGAGHLEAVIDQILGYMAFHDCYELLVFCGNHKALYDRLLERKMTHVQVMMSTDQMDLYVKGADVLLTKPGGLSSTEAAIAGIPLMHLPPIPGCEQLNMLYFSGKGMCYPVRDVQQDVQEGLVYLEDQSNLEKMKLRQKAGIPQDGLEQLCLWLEAEVQSRKKREFLS